MATVFPSSPVGSLPKEVLKMFTFLKTLDGYHVWHRLAPYSPGSPDFLILNPKRKAALIKVSLASANAKPGQMLLLTPDGAAPLGEVETKALTEFALSLDPEVAAKISKVVVFANVSREALKAALPSDQAQVRWVSKDFLAAGDLNRWASIFKQPALDDREQDRLRSCFCPEVVVPAYVSVRTQTHANLPDGDFLLDLDQEWAIKSELDLPSEQKQLSKSINLRIVNGVAGSGKSLILLYRLKLLKQFFPDQRFLVITHNRPLIRDLQAKFKKLNPGQEDNIDWYTFMQLCGHLSKKRLTSGKTISIGERQRIFEDLWQSEFDRSSLSPRLIGNEIEWFKDQTFLRPEDYLTFNRRGRGFRVQDREVMLKTILKYDEILKAKKKVDWADIPLALWRDLEAQRTKPKPYDVIFIDEAQFFAPVWFAIIDHILKPNSGHLFVVADPTQGFLRKGASWKSLGLDARGKTQHLSKSYRTTMEILNFSTLLYRNRSSDTDDDIVFPDLENMPAGPLPDVIPVSKPQDEIRKTVEYIVEMLSKHKIPPDQILVLHANWEGANAVVRELVTACGKDSAGDPKDRDPGGFVRVTTINAGTGIESRFVFLLGLNTIFEEEQSLRISDEERAALINENSKKLYMAMTRAGQRLFITYAGEIPKAFSHHRVRH